jgi:hypothetical protein
MRSVTHTFATALLAAVCQFSTASAQTPPTQSPQPDIPPVQSSQPDNSQAQSSQPDNSQAQSPQPDSPPAQSSAPTNPATSIPDQKLDAAAAAIQRVAILERAYLQQFEAASPDEQPRIANEASDAIEKAVTDQGLSVEEYTTILEVAQNDPQVRDKIIKRIQTPAD